MKRTLLLLLSGLGLGVLGNAVHPQGLPLAQPVYALAEQGLCTADSHPGTAPAAKAPAPAEPISPEQVQALRTSGVVFGDLRPARQYAEGHIAGALHLPCTGSLGQEALRHLPQGGRLLIYDADGRSADLATAAATAAQRGLQVYTLTGGFSAWLRAGLPAESGSCEKCGQD